MKENKYYGVCDLEAFFDSDLARFLKHKSYRSLTEVKKRRRKNFRTENHFNIVELKESLTEASISPKTNNRNKATAKNSIAKAVLLFSGFEEYVSKLDLNIKS